MMILRCTKKLLSKVKPSLIATPIGRESSGRELRAGITADGKTKLKSPSSALSTAEALSVMNNGLSLAAHFGDGTLRAQDLAAGLLGAVLKDPVQDRTVWLEYLETVVKEREGWKDLYRACRCRCDGGVVAAGTCRDAATCFFAVVCR